MIDPNTGHRIAREYELRLAEKSERLEIALNAAKFWREACERALKQRDAECAIADRALAQRHVDRVAVIHAAEVRGATWMAEAHTRSRMGPPFPPICQVCEGEGSVIYGDDPSIDDGESETCETCEGSGFGTPEAICAARRGTPG